MLKVKDNPHRFLATTLPKRPPTGVPFLCGREGWDLPGYALELFGLSYKDAAGQTPPPNHVTDPLAFLDTPIPLWTHQIKDAQRLCSGRFGEWAEVGLGKTHLVLAAFNALRRAGKVDRLVVCGPESASHAWVEDARVWGLSVCVVTDKVKTKGLPEANIYFTNYDKAWREPYAGRLLAVIRNGRAVMVLDECHLTIGPASKRFLAIDHWARFCQFTWLLSGTPVQNYPDRLWGIYRLLTRDATSYEEWCGWFCKGDFKTYHSDRLAALGRYMKRFTSVRTRKEVAPSLPPTTIRTIRVPLIGEQRKRYGELLDSAEGADDREWMGILQKLLSTCSHPDLGRKALSTPDSKLETLLEVLESCGEVSVVVWSWHPDTLDWLARKLPYTNVRYHGGTSANDRAEAIRKFNSGEAKIFLGNPSAAGAGLNLPRGMVRVYFDAAFSSVQYSQSAGRIERGLHYEPKTEFRLVADDTVESLCWEAIQRKQDLASLILRGNAAAIQETGKGVVRRWRR